MAQLLAGTAKQKLQYPEHFFPHKGFRGRYFTGIHDELYVRTLYLESAGEGALIVSLELGDIGRQWLKEIADAIGISEDHVFLAATHTHSAPHIDSTWKEDVIDVAQGEAFAALCKNTVIASARQAKQAARPAALQYGSGSCDINCNRDFPYQGKYVQAPNPHGLSDKTVALLKVTDAQSGRTIAYLVNYAIHSLVTFYQTWTYEDSMLISSDLAGAAMDYVEKRLDDGAIAMFLLGAAADQMPRYIANHRQFELDGTVTWHYEGREAAFAMTSLQAVPLAQEILRIGKSMQQGAAEVRVQAVSQMVSSMGKVEGMRMQAKKGEEHKAGGSYDSQYKETAIEGFHYTPTEPIEMQLGLLRLGDISIVTVPAEIVCHIGQMMRAAVEESLGGKAIIVSQCNGAYSYITDDDGYHNMTFEALSSHFMPGIAYNLEHGARKLAEKVQVLCEKGAKA